MNKKKEPKTFLSFFRYTVRVWIVSMPAAIILATLFFFEKISWQWALGLMFLVMVVSAIITTSVLKELEEFIAYLKTLAQGFEIEPPHFKRGIFSSNRLAETFQSVKKIWSNQTLSDGSILMHLPIPMIMLDENGKIVFMNDKAQTVFGMDKLNQSIKSLWGQTEINRLQKVLHEESATELLELQFNEDEFQARIERLPAPTRNKAIVVITFNDITPFKRFRKQQSEFFANASHELKTPLSIISGVVETLQGPAKEDETARTSFLKMISEQTNRMTSLVQNLLELSHQQVCPDIPHKDIISLRYLTKELVQEFKIKLQTQKQHLILKSKQKLPSILGNQITLRHAFQNLIDNAIKYGDKDSEITITLSQDKKDLIWSVHNFGQPIEAYHLDKLFDRFYRVSGTKKISGTGLGLSIAQQVIQDHGGRIEVMSTKSLGTTFTVYLPIKN